jgi:hypothetical protein
MINNIYRYIREDGGITDSLIQPDCEYTLRYRLIADDGKVYTNGEITITVLDVDSIEGWHQIDATSVETEG